MRRLCKISFLSVIILSTLIFIDCTSCCLEFPHNIYIHFCGMFSLIIIGVFEFLIVEMADLENSPLEESLKLRRKRWLAMDLCSIFL